MIIVSSALKEEAHKWAHQADKHYHINPDVSVLTREGQRS